jgi:hypothetical protein
MKKPPTSVTPTHDGPHPFIVQAIVAILRDNPMVAATSCLSALKQFDLELEIAPMNLGLVVRELGGNPFRPVTLNPSWLTSTVLSLANSIYAERAFERMPILADALQDAGCDNEDILNHCRQSGVHIRGCFVVDLLLGKS